MVLRRSRTIGFFAAFLPFLPACIKELPAPAEPQQVAPAVRWPSKPPADNQGRVAIDTTRGPAIVELVEGRTQVATTDGYGVGVMTRRLCTTPCTTDLPLGEHELRLRVKDAYELGIVPVKVGETPSAVRVDLGWQDPGAPVERLMGVSLFTTGLVTFLTGMAFGLTTSGESSHFGWGMSLVGAGMGGFGLYLTIDAGGEIRPTSYTQWDLSAPTAQR
jgi:hypothetical protein